MKIALSTSWKPDILASQLVESLQRLDPDCLVLGPSLSAETRQRLLRWKRPIVASSLYTVRPDGISPWSDLSQTLPICTDDREIRQRALLQAEEDMLFCEKSRCCCLLVSLRVPASYPERRLLDLYCLGLEPLLELAFRRGIRLALQLQERLGVEQLVRLRQIFSGAPLGYWHREENVGVLPEAAPIDPYQQSSGGLFLLSLAPPTPAPLPDLVFPEILESCVEGIAFSELGSPQEPWPAAERLLGLLRRLIEKNKEMVCLYEVSESGDEGMLRESLAWFRAS
jgi:hypothetical protein